jgi:hypothetical protein
VPLAHTSGDMVHTLSCGTFLITESAPVTVVAQQAHPDEACSGNAEHPETLDCMLRLGREYVAEARYGLQSTTTKRQRHNTLAGLQPARVFATGFETVEGRRTDDRAQPASAGLPPGAFRHQLMLTLTA